MRNQTQKHTTVQLRASEEDDPNPLPLFTEYLLCAVEHLLCLPGLSRGEVLGDAIRQMVHWFVLKTVFSDQCL